MAIRWDYRTVVLSSGHMGRHIEELDRKALDAQLDQLGKLGFELAWVLSAQTLRHEDDGHVLIFKRELTAEPSTPVTIRRNDEQSG